MSYTQELLNKRSAENKLRLLEGDHLKCILCDKTMVPRGDKRKNGKTGFRDWASREIHKDCYPLYEFAKKIKN